MDAEDESVWEFVSNPEVLMESVPGTQEVIKHSKTEYEGTIERGVAGVSISLSGRAEIIELNPPQRIVSKVSGEDTTTNSDMNAVAEMEIIPTSDYCTLEYSVDLDFGGPLTKLGPRIVERKIKSDIDLFFSNIKGIVEDGQ